MPQDTWAAGSSILLFHCHQYQIHCNITILHTYAVYNSYITVGVRYLCYYTELRMTVNNKDMPQLSVITNICYCDTTGLIPTYEL